MMSGNNDNCDLSKGVAWPEIVAFSILMIVINIIAISSSMVTINTDIVVVIFKHLTASHIEKAYAGWWPTH